MGFGEKIRKAIQEGIAPLAEYKAFADPESQYYEYTKPYLEKYNIKYVKNGSMRGDTGGKQADKEKAYKEFMADYGVSGLLGGDDYYRVSSEYRSGLLADNQYGIGSSIQEIAQMRKDSEAYLAEMQAEHEKEMERIREENRKKMLEAQTKADMEANKARIQNQTVITSSETVGVDGRRRALRNQNEKHSGGSIGVKNLGVLGTMAYGGSLGRGGLY